MDLNLYDSSQKESKLTLSHLFYLSGEKSLSQQLHHQQKDFQKQSSLSSHTLTANTLTGLNTLTTAVIYCSSKSFYLFISPPIISCFVYTQCISGACQIVMLKADIRGEPLKDMAFFCFQQVSQESLVLLSYWRFDLESWFFHVICGIAYDVHYQSSQNDTKHLLMAKNYNRFL